MGNADVIRELIARWNAGDAEIHTGPHWPEDVTYRGRDEIRRTSAEWASIWESLQVELETIEEHGDKVLATGAWAAWMRSVRALMCDSSGPG